MRIRPTVPGFSWTASDLADKAAAIAAIGWFLVSIRESLGVAMGPGNGVAGTIMRGAHAANAALLVIIIGFLLTRRSPVEKASGVWPRVFAGIGLIAPMALVLVPPVRVGNGAAVASAILVFAGTLAATWAVLHLGRSFAFFPQARALVTRGPYRLVRHPLYLAEVVVVAGLMVERSQPWAAAVFGLAVLSQVPRMRAEERVLSAAFPDYPMYAEKKARLIPGVY